MRHLFSLASAVVAQSLFLLVSTGCPGGGFDQDWHEAVSEIQELAESPDLSSVADFEDSSQMFADLADALKAGDSCASLVEEFNETRRGAQKTSFGSKLGNVAKGTAVAVFSTLGAAVDLRDALEALPTSEAAEMLNLEETEYLELLSDYSFLLDDLVARLAKGGLAKIQDWQSEENEGGLISRANELLGHELTHVVQQRAGARATIAESVAVPAALIAEMRHLNDEVVTVLAQVIELSNSIHSDLDIRFSSERSCVELSSNWTFLQNSAQEESRKYQTLSNASKTRHETAMNSVRNMRA